MKAKKRIIYWYNPSIAKTGELYYITISEERAIELFRQNYNEDYKIMKVI